MSCYFVIFSHVSFFAQLDGKYFALCPDLRKPNLHFGGIIGVASLNVDISDSLSGSGEDLN